MGGKYTDTVIRVEERLEALKEDIGDLKKSISGNGQVGLEERLTRLEENHSQLVDVIEAQSDNIGDITETANRLLDVAELVEESPSLLAMARQRPIRAVLTVLSSIVLAVTFWLTMYTITSIPGVQIFMLELLSIPTAVP